LQTIDEELDIDHIRTYEADRPYWVMNQKNQVGGAHMLPRQDHHARMHCGRPFGEVPILLQLPQIRRSAHLSSWRLVQRSH